MQSFQEPSKKLVAEFLSATDMFREVDPDSILKLAQELEIIFLLSQEVLVQEGDIGEEMFIVYTGRLRVFKTVNNKQKIIGELGARDSVGEIAVLINQPRMATVKAIRDTILIKLTNNVFLKFAKQYPEAALNIAKGSLARVLTFEKKEKSGKKIATITLLPMSLSPIFDTFKNKLLAALEKHGSIQLITAKMVKEKFKENLEGIFQWLNDLETNFKYIIYIPDYQFSNITELFVRQSDVVYLINDKDATQESKHNIQQYILENNSVLQRTSLVILKKSSSEKFEPMYSWIIKHELANYHHVILDQQKDFDRLARFITGKSIGLVLAGGGALACAHMGLFRALEERNIPIDLVGGTSAGAFVGGAIAMGLSAEEIEERYLPIAQRSTKFKPTFPYVSISTARNLVDGFKEAFGESRIEELPRRFFCVSTNITSGEINVHDSGLIWESIRASATIPGIYPPLFSKGNLFVDGALLNNLPVSVMFQKFDAGKVIASRLAKKREGLSTDFGATDLSGWAILRNKLNPFSKKINVPRIDAILARSFALSEENQQINQAKRADLCILLELNNYKLFDFDKYKDIMELGYQQAKIALEKWPL